MRKILSKEELVTPKSVKFLYNTTIGKICLKVITLRFISKIVGKYLDSKLSCSRIKIFRGIIFTPVTFSLLLRIITPLVIL